MEGRIKNSNSERTHIKYFQKENLIANMRNDTKRHFIEMKIETTI